MITSTTRAHMREQKTKNTGYRQDDAENSGQAPPQQPGNEIRTRPREHLEMECAGAVHGDDG